MLAASSGATRFQEGESMDIIDTTNKMMIEGCDKMVKDKLSSIGHMFEQVEKARTLFDERPSLMTGRALAFAQETTEKQVEKIVDEIKLKWEQAYKGYVSEKELDELIDTLLLKHRIVRIEK